MSARNYMVQIDGLRTLAIAMVVLAHYASFPGLTEVNSFVGIAALTLFLVLSGFLITTILIDNKKDAEVTGKTNRFILKRFFARRLLRIFPLYYFVLLVGLVFALPRCRNEAVWLLSYTANWLPVTPQTDLKFFSHLWSLNVEEQYYLLFPLVLMTIKRTYWLPLFTAMVVAGIGSRAGIVIAKVYQGKTDAIFWATFRNTAGCFDAFGIGAFLAYFKIYETEKTRQWLHNRKVWAVSALLLAAAGVLVMTSTHTFPSLVLDAVLSRTLLSLACVCLIGLASFSEITGRAGNLLRHRVIVYLGKISYGIYVYHYIMPYFFENFRVTSHDALNLVISRSLCVAITLVVSSLSWFLLEKPILGLKKYFDYDKKQRAAVVPAARPENVWERVQQKPVLVDG